MPINFDKISIPKTVYTIGSVYACAQITETMLEKYPHVTGPALPLLFVAGVAIVLGGNSLIDKIYS